MGKERQQFKLGQQVFLHVAIPRWWIKRASLLPEDTNCLAKGIIAGSYRQEGKLYFKVKISHIATHTPPSHPIRNSIIKKMLSSTVKRNIDQIHSSVTTWMEQVYRDVYWSGLNNTQEREITNRIVNR